jgi:hypothetical protein
MAAGQSSNGKKISAWVGPLFLGFGIAFFTGAYVAVVSGEWPNFLPPQIDLFGLVFRAFGNPVEGYLASVFLFALGVGSSLMGIAAIKMEQNR